MDKMLKTIYTDFLRAHQKVMGDFKNIREKLPEQSLLEKVDTSFFARELSSLADNIRKEANKLQELSGKLVVLHWSQDVSAPAKYKTQYCTGTPDMSMYVPMPTKKDPDNLDKLMEHFGVPANIYCKDIVRLHYPGWIEYLSDLAKNGKPLPPGVDSTKQTPVFELKLRKRQELTE